MDQDLVENKQVKESPQPSKTEKRLKIVIIISGILLVLGSLTAIWFQYASTPKFCNLCHEMTPEYVTWEASSHNKLACTECHKVDYFNQAYKHVRQEYLLPITQPEPISNQVCDKCHDIAKRVVTPSGDIKIPHDKHLAKGIACVNCHSGVAHGTIAIRQQTIDGDFDRWTEAMGQAQMSPEFRATGMKQCIECHKERKVATTCETCHLKIVMPPNHKTAEWIGTGQHGIEARKDIQGCNKCHSFTKDDQLIIGVDDIAEYARTNSFCFDCHSKQPSSHGDNWRAVHGSKAQGAARQNCLVCHSSAKSKPTDKATKTYCQKCHNSKHAFFNRDFHPISLPQGTKVSQACANCHRLSLCATCHFIPGVPITREPTLDTRR